MKFKNLEEFNNFQNKNTIKKVNIMEKFIFNEDLLNTIHLYPNLNSIEAHIEVSDDKLNLLYTFIDEMSNIDCDVVIIKIVFKKTIIFFNKNIKMYNFICL